jgi:hypothetical protein
MVRLVLTQPKGALQPPLLRLRPAQPRHAHKVVQAAVHAVQAAVVHPGSSSRVLALAPRELIPFLLASEGR